jgi:hypothetical protein
MIEKNKQNILAMEMMNIKLLIIALMMTFFFHSALNAAQSKKSAAESMLRNSDWSAEFKTTSGNIYVDPSSRTKIAEGVYTINVRVPPRMSEGPFAWRDMPIHMQVYTIEVRCRDFQYKEIGWISQHSNRPRSVIGGGKSRDLDGRSIFYLSACSDDYLSNHLRSMTAESSASQNLSVNSAGYNAQPTRVSQQPGEATLTSNTQTCAGYGFKLGTTDFGQCLMQLDEAQRQAQLQQQQYELQLAQYQQQVAAYNAQQEEIKRERNRREGEALLRMSQGVLNSRSPSILGVLADGFEAVNGTPLPPPVAPSPPVAQNYTIRMPNGKQVFCYYNSMAGYMSCR